MRNRRSQWKPYVSVGERRLKAKKAMEKLVAKGQDVQPVELEGSTIARTFWGKGWCDHLESFSDFENRLPRGRSYVRNGSVCHLEIKAGLIEAIVSGSSLYKVAIRIEPLKREVWKAVKDKCRGRIGSMLELLQGRLSHEVMAVVSDRTSGLFPQPGEIHLHCSCPDWAEMCKHVAAAFYGVGSRLDTRPELLFLLRGVDAAELIAAEPVLPAAAAGDTLSEADLAGLFGIDLVAAPAAPATAAPPKKKTKAAKATKAKMPAKAPREIKATKAAKPTKAAKLPPAKAAAMPPVKPPAKAPAKPAARCAKPLFDPGAPTGAAIARLRARAGLSKTEFARTLDVSANSVERWEASGTAVLRLQARPLAALLRLQVELAKR